MKYHIELLMDENNQVLRVSKGSVDQLWNSWKHYCDERSLNRHNVRRVKVHTQESSFKLYAHYLLAVYTHDPLNCSKRVRELAKKVWGEVGPSKVRGNKANLKPNDSLGIRDLPTVSEPFSWGA